MASGKRKSLDQAASDKLPSQHTKGQEPVAKRQRKDKQATTTTDDKAAPTADRNLPTASLLQDTDRSFPRGGAGVLTPLEHKQIQLQATKDALFEESGQKRSDYGPDSEHEDPHAPKHAHNSKKGRRSKSNVDSIDVETFKRNRVRVDGLKSKVISYADALILHKLLTHRRISRLDH